MNKSSGKNATPIAITLPDGSVKTFDEPVSGADIAASIGPGEAPAHLRIHGSGVVLPGDVVTWMLPGNVPHIGIVTLRRAGGQPLIAHNIGRGPELEAMLFEQSKKSISEGLEVRHEL